MLKASCGRRSPSGTIMQKGRMMKKLNRVSVGNALIWAAAILASAVILRGTQYVTMMIVILGGAAGVSVIMVEGALRKG
jgi:hypothetical protein